MDGNENTVVSLEEAMGMAQESGLDLVQVGGNQERAVCKVMDYNKFLYEQHKREKKNRSKNKQELKEVRLSDGTAENDLKVKAKNISRILKEGDKVQIVITYKGRMVSFISRGLDKLKDIEKLIEQAHIVDKAPKIEGNRVYMVLSPKR